MGSESHSKRLLLEPESRTGQIDSLRRHLQGKSQVFHLAQGHQDGDMSLFHYIEVCPSWWFRRKFYPTRLCDLGCLPVCKGEPGCGGNDMALDAIFWRLLHESCHRCSGAHRPCAAEIQDHVGGGFLDIHHAQGPIRPWSAQQSLPDVIAGARLCAGH